MKAYIIEEMWVFEIIAESVYRFFMWQSGRVLYIITFVFCVTTV